jgi:tetratricopeptide (TPR) repeat protein
MERRFGGVHPGVAAVIQNIGDLHLDRGEFEKANEYFVRAGRIICTVLGTQNRLYAASLFKQAKAWQGLELYSGALPFLRQAFEIRRALYGLDADIVIECVVEIAECQMAEGEFRAASETLQQVLDELGGLQHASERSTRRLQARLAIIGPILGFAGPGTQTRDQ